MWVLVFPFNLLNLLSTPLHSPLCPGGWSCIEFRLGSANGGHRWKSGGKGGVIQRYLFLLCCSCWAVTGRLCSLTEDLDSYQAALCTWLRPSLYSPGKLLSLEVSQTLLTPTFVNSPFITFSNWRVLSVCSPSIWRMFLRWDLSYVFLTSTLGLWVFGNVTEVKCHFTAWYQGRTLSAWLIPVGVHLDVLAESVFIRLLHCKVPPCPLSVRYASGGSHHAHTAHAKGVGS